MEQSNRRVEVRGSDLADVQRIVGMDGLLDEAEVARRSWSVFEIDDKAIFDKDARHLASAFRVAKSDCFYVARVSDLMTSMGTLTAYQFEATQDEIEAFQGPSWFEVNLDDCLLFTLPFTCAVLRPGYVDRTKFVGSIAFIAEISKL